jgi:hypothetical protein
MRCAEVNYKGLPLSVYYELVPPYRGSRDKYGAPEEPDEDGGIEVDDVSITCCHVSCQEISIMELLSETQMEEIIRLVTEYIGEESDAI